MTKKQLEEMGLSTEQAASVIGLHEEEMGEAKGASDAEIKNMQTEISGYKAQIADRDRQLEGLKKSGGDSEGLKKQIEELQQQNAEQKKAHEAELKQLRLDNAVDAALAAAGARNGKAVKALLDMSKVKMDDGGKLAGFDEQVAAVQKSDAYLFAEKQAKPNFRGFQPGASGSIKPDTKVDMSKMSYEELAAYIENSPDTE